MQVCSCIKQLQGDLVECVCVCVCGGGGIVYFNLLTEGKGGREER